MSKVNNKVEKVVEELKKEAVDSDTQDDGSGHRSETTYTFYMSDIEKAITKHAEVRVREVTKAKDEEIEELKDQLLEANEQIDLNDYE